MKRALLFGLLCWIIIFVEVSVIGFTPNLATRGEFGFTLLPAGIAAHFVFLGILAWAISRMYFRKSTGPLSRSPTAAGATVIATGFLLDAIVTVPMFVKDYGYYYSKWTLWVGALVFIAFYVFAHKIKAKS